MSSDQYRREVARYQSEIAKHQEAKAKLATKAIGDRNKAREATLAAHKATSVSTQRSKLNDAQRYEKSAAGHEKSIADYESKIAAAQKRLNDSASKLAKAAEQEDRKRLTAARAQDQARQRDLSLIRGALTRHEHLHSLAMSTLAKMQQLPDRLTVLFLASNPSQAQPLRLDEEVRAIAEMIRKSEHRDSIRLESRWAVRPLDVLQAINECSPRIIHFSGHGSDRDEIIFQDAAGLPKAVSKEAIVQTIAAGSDDVQLVFFNTCYSHAQAEAVVAHVPAAIGMTTSIGDEAARVFAAAFYSSIGFGHSIGRAFLQGKSALMLEGISENDTPELFMTEGLEPDDFVLVKARSNNP